MNITLESDYAIRIIACLAACEKRMDAKQISEITGVTLRVSLKILRKLVASGLVKSFKGMQGGYEMNRTPDHITLLDVLRVIEGEYYLNRCAVDEFICTFRGKKDCKVRKIFTEVSSLVNEKLSSVTIADIL
jgi:Rrf2 family protein